jgi:hypothetical protein
MRRIEFPVILTSSDYCEKFKVESKNESCHNLAFFIVILFTILYNEVKRKIIPNTVTIDGPAGKS